MEAISQSFIGVELKPHYFNDFISCGIPLPAIYDHATNFVLKFINYEHYLSYRSLLKAILYDLQQADTENRKYEIQRSKAFIKNILSIMREQSNKKNS